MSYAPSARRLATPLAAALLWAAPLAAQPAAPAAPAELAWFHGSWNLVYEDTVLGPVRGRAEVTATGPKLEVRLRYRDPRSERIHTLRPAAAPAYRAADGILELRFENASPASGYSMGAPAARGLAVAGGRQLQARLEGAPPAYVIVGSNLAAAPDPSLVLRLAVPEKDRESLQVRWSYGVREPADMAGSRAGRIVERQGQRYAEGDESWVRPAPVIAGATDADLPSPARLAAIHRERQFPDGSTGPGPERAAIEKQWGAQAWAATWLRIAGADLPLQPGRRVDVTFDDPGLRWTGEFRGDPEFADVLDVRVVIARGVAAGEKRFTVNGGEGRWAYAMEPVAIRHLRSLAFGGAPQDESGESARFETAEELYPGEIFYVEAEYAAAPEFSQRSFATQSGDDPPLRVELEATAARRHVFVSGPILLSGHAPQDPEAEEGSAPPITVAGSVRGAAGGWLETYEPEARVPSHGRTVALTRVGEAPPPLWNQALRTAAECRRAGLAPAEVSRRIVTAGFEKRSLAISLEDHAAALVLRDELVLELDRYAATEKKALARGGAIADAYAAQIIAAVRGMRRPPITDIEVASPDYGERIPLFSALTPEMESRTFRGDGAAFFRYARREVDAARRTLADRAAATAGSVRSIDGCDVEAMLGTVRAGLGPVVSNAQARLFRPPRRGEPAVPRWVPDRVARGYVASLGVLAEAVKAQNDHSSVDTDVVIAAATTATLVGGGLAGVGGRLAAKKGYEATASAAGRMAGGAAWAGVALDVTDLGLMANDLAEYGEALDEVRLAEGLVGIAGDARLQEARAEAEARAFGLALGGAMLGGATVAHGVRIVRSGSTPAGKAAAVGEAAPASPAGSAAPSPGFVPDDAADTRPLTNAEARPARDPLSGGVFDRPDFRDVPRKPPPEPIDLTPWMTPEELASRPPVAVRPQGGDAVDSGAATVVEPGRRPAGPTDTVPNEPRADAGVPLLERPPFRDLPEKPRPENVDLAPYRTPEEQAAYERLVHSDTAALPAAGPEAPAASAPSESRIARAGEETAAVPDAATPRVEEFDPTVSDAGPAAPLRAEEFDPHPLQRESKYRDQALSLSEERRRWDLEHEVVVFTPQQLEEFRVVADSQGRLIYARSGRRVEATQGIYVMDVHGNVFVHANPQHGAIHHSSLSGGRDPAGAGQIWVEDGRIRTLDEYTGHYSSSQPKGRVSTVAKELASQGIDLRGATLVPFDKD